MTVPCPTTIPEQTLRLFDATHDTLFFTRNYQRFYHISLSAALDSAR